MGPVFLDVVDPVFLVQSKSSVLSWVQLHRFWSKLQLNGPVLGVVDGMDVTLGVENMPAGWGYTVKQNNIYLRK